MPRTPEDVPTDADALIRVGTVASVDLESGTCTVRLDGADEGGDDAVTPRVRWLHPRMGEMKVWAPPSVGEQGLLLCPAGELGAGIFVGGLHSNANPPPIDEPVAVLRFKDGAVLSYDPDAHKLLMQLPSGATTVLVSDGGIDIQGDVSVNGTITASEDVIGASKSLKNHRHSRVSTGGSQTGAPV